MTAPLVNITIPTYNRAASCLEKAIDSALNQSYENFSITVVDDGSTDHTKKILRQYENEPNFAGIVLARNAGTAKAKNAGLLFSDYEAITFHDSDDIPCENKILLQLRALCLKGHKADEILDWNSVNHATGSDLNIDIVVGGYDLLKMDGSVHYINKRISLLDDFFPNMQFPSKTEGDWVLVNAGMFRRSVFEELGGYLNSIEEDREIRNRTIAAGCVYFFVDQPLLTKIEMDDSLTMETYTGYRGEKRKQDRSQVWNLTKQYRLGMGLPEVCHDWIQPVDLDDVEIDEIINAHLLKLNTTIPMTAATQNKFSKIFTSRNTVPGARHQDSTNVVSIA